jgi:hypothetical protein
MCDAAMDREANRLRALAVIIAPPPEDVHANAHQVKEALVSQLHLPRHTIRVTKYNDLELLAEFGSPPDKSRALGMGCLDLGGFLFPIRPWLSAGGGEEVNWWFHVKVVMENVPLEAWNEEGVRLILGDSCVFDRFDSKTAARENSQFLGCWVWVHDTYIPSGNRCGPGLVGSGSSGLPLTANTGVRAG